MSVVDKKYLDDLWKQNQMPPVSHALNKKVDEFVYNVAIAQRGADALEQETINVNKVLNWIKQMEEDNYVI